VKRFWVGLWTGLEMIAVPTNIIIIIIINGTA
jgi:hypothetical protein